MNNPTGGNITFLFTDIEGSTKLSQEFPESLQSALDKHHAIMHNAIESNNGYVFEIVGDAFCCAFEKAEDAVKAAVDAQLGLANEKWEDAVIKIRIGIHTGPAEWNGKRYMGYITLARSARVMSCGYGEQIIISGSTYELCKEKFDAVKEKNISFRDMGERRMKDVIQPIRIYQIISPGLREDFPPLKTLDARPNNLPVQLTSFIGRDLEMKQIKDLLKNTRLLSLIGSGGSGKTRLAMHAGAEMIDDFTNGVFIAELASVSDPSFILQTLAVSLGVKEEQGISLKDTLTAYLKNMELLIILDNCEHLISECANLTELLLSKCSGLKILTTSREALNCMGEQTFRIPSLSHPDTSTENSPEKLSQYESVRLFIERAMSVNPNFRVNNENAPALAEICSRLDGIPLTIELAAARTNVLPLEKIHERLDDRFKLLSGGRRTALPRQQTLKAMIDWSYDLLPQSEKKLWHRISVFNGGWNLEPAEEICSSEEIANEDILDLLNQLADKSIIIYDHEKNRYRILESIRQYGREKLKSENETDEVKTGHLSYFMKLAETAEPELNIGEVQVWLNRLEEEHGNIQSAIDWSVSGGDKENGARLAGALGQFWHTRGHYFVGSRLIEKFLADKEGINLSSLSKLIRIAGMLSSCQGDYEKAGIYFEECLKLYRQTDDKKSISNVMNELGMVVYYGGNFDEAEKILKESLALSIETGNKHDESTVLSCLGQIARNRGNYEEAQKFLEESLSLSRKIGDKLRIVDSLNGLGIIIRNRGDYKLAQKYLEEGLEIAREIGDKLGITNSLISLGNAEIIRREYEKAYNYFEESYRIASETGNKRGAANSLNFLGRTSIDLGYYDKARKYINESLELYVKIGYNLGAALSLRNLGRLEKCQGNYETATEHLNDSLKKFRDLGYKPGIAGNLLIIGSIYLINGNFEESQICYQESLNISRELGEQDGIISSLIGFACILSSGKNIPAAVQILGSIESAIRSAEKSLDNSDNELRDTIIKKLHENISDEEYSGYFEEGMRMTLEEAGQLTVDS